MTFDDSGVGTESTVDEVSVLIDKGVPENNSGSQSSWHFEDQFTMNPKISTLIQERKASGVGMNGSVYIYHGHFGVLYSQKIFDNEIEDWSEMYDLDTGITGKPTVINKPTISEKLKNVSNVIQFRVFFSAYRRAYVGRIRRRCREKDCGISS